jgi:hypothetical protein
MGTQNFFYQAIKHCPRAVSIRRPDFDIKELVSGFSVRIANIFRRKPHCFKRSGDRKIAERDQERMELLMPSDLVLRSVTKGFAYEPPVQASFSEKNCPIKRLPSFSVDVFFPRAGIT